MQLIRELKTVARLYRQDPFFLRLWLANRNVQDWNCSDDIVRQLKGRKALLIIHHSNFIESVSGVDKETYEMVRWLSTGKYKNIPILVYFYSRPYDCYGLHYIQNGRLFRQWRTQEPKPFLKDLITNIAFKLCIIESLVGHELESVQKIHRKGLKTIGFIHDFFFLCPCPYLPFPGKYIQSENKCSIIEDLPEQVCEFKVKRPVAGDIHYDEMKMITGTYQRYIKVTRNLLSVDEEMWRTYTKEILVNYFDYVVFSSELTMQRHLKILNIAKQRHFTVSYPNFIGRKLYQ